MTTIRLHTLTMFFLLGGATGIMGAISNKSVTAIIGIVNMYAAFILNAWCEEGDEK